MNNEVGLLWELRETNQIFPIWRPTHLPHLSCGPGGFQLRLADGRHWWRTRRAGGEGGQRPAPSDMHTGTHRDRAAERAELLLDGPSHGAQHPPFGLQASEWGFLAPRKLTTPLLLSPSSNCSFKFSFHHIVWVCHLVSAGPWSMQDVKHWTLRCICTRDEFFSFWPKVLYDHWASPAHGSPS